MDPIPLRAQDAPAVLHQDGSVLSHRDLLTMVDACARTLPRGGRRLVGLLGDRELGSVVAYLAALRSGNAVACFGAARSQERMSELVRRYEPEVLVGPAPVVAEVAELLGYRLQAAGPGHGVVVAHACGPRAPDVDEGTSLVLFTSGSVSGGRGVRLSGTAIAANATGIAEALGIDASWRGATSLPLYYSYGLSVLSSHLTAGGSIVLTTDSATSTAFWRRFDSLECNVFNGVPAHYDWLDRSPVPWHRIPGLHTVTCAGAPIRPALAARVHALCSRHGVGFVKMYGQTEATARISILRAEDYPEHPESVGRVLAGSRVSFDADGQLVYHGPSAMSGYCDDRAGLAAPDQVRGTVHTGDLGFEQDGFLHVTGRLSRFVKPFGRRISLDALETVFSEITPAAVVGDAAERAHVFLAATSEPELEAARRTLLDRFSLPPDTIQLHYETELPRLSNGKTDYRRLAERTATTTGEADV